MRVGCNRLVLLPPPKKQFCSTSFYPMRSSAKSTTRVCRTLNVTVFCIGWLLVSGTERNTLTSANMTLVWHAPFGSFGGYAAEALDYLPAFVSEIRHCNHYCATVQRCNSQTTVEGVHCSCTSSRRISNFAIVHHGDTAIRRASDVSEKKRRAVQATLLEVMVPANHFDRLVVVCHSEPGAWSTPTANYDAQGACPPLSNSKRPALTIGRTMFETDRLPSGWVERLNHRFIDQIWVPTEFNRETFRAGGVAPHRLRVIPESIDTEEWTPQVVPSLDNLDHHRLSADFMKLLQWINGTGIGRSQCDTVFLSVFKWEDRKNWRALVQAFFSEFDDRYRTITSDGDDRCETALEAAQRRRSRACLVIKTHPYHDADIQETDTQDDDTQDAEEINDASEEFEGRVSDYLANLLTAPKLHQTRCQVNEGDLRPRFRIVDRSFSDVEMRALYTASSAFVLPSHGEGWGRPMMEAMSMGRAVIATNWSGILEIGRHLPPGTNGNLSTAIFLPLRIANSLIDVGGDGPFRSHRWANPSISHLRRLMRWVHDHPAAARAVGARARSYVVSQFSSEKVVRQMLQSIHDTLLTL